MVTVTGAAGHVGANLVRELLARGEDVRVLVHRDVRALEGLAVERVQTDIRDPESLAEAFKGAKKVFHLAAQISITGSMGGLVDEVNVRGTQNVVEACLRRGVGRLVHFSSIHAVCPGDGRPEMDEKSPYVDAKKGVAYDCSKAMGERVVREGMERGLDAVIVGPTAVIGPYDFKLSPMGEVLYNLFRGKMPALVNGGFDWVDARDVAAGAILAAEKGGRGERYLLSGHYYSLRELALLAEGVSGVKAPSIAVPIWLAGLGAPFSLALSKLTGKRPLYTPESLRALRESRPVSSRKARDELGYSPRPLGETVRD
ncbi:MAG TPA: NAD-dependent epimerase/dehydratase family protein, partial [Spirochaetes bacterium]|nr:NAD-dependent epimerase/dehydratase family protein [Spirochaetota bacterium]